MPRNAAYEAYVASQRQHAVQLAHLLADPLITDWIEPERVLAFVDAELGGFDPYTARIAMAEADWLDRLHTARAALPGGQ